MSLLHGRSECLLTIFAKSPGLTGFSRPAGLVNFFYLPDILDLLDLSGLLVLPDLLEFPNLLVFIIESPLFC